MSKSIYRSGELTYSRSNILLGERPGVSSLRSKYLRDVEDEISRVQRELNQLRGTYEGDVKRLAEEYSRKKAALEAELAEVRRTTETEIRKIRDTAQAEVDREKKRGYDEGFVAGRTDGEKAAGQAIAGEMAVMRQKIGDSRETFLARVAGSETKIIETSLAIAERIVRQKIQIDPNVVRETVREVVAQIRDNHPVRIRVHPDEIARLNEFKKLDPDAFRDIPATFIPDETLSPGDCIAETGLEFIDATVSKKLETLRDRLIPRTVI